MVYLKDLEVYQNELDKTIQTIVTLEEEEGEEGLVAGEERKRLVLVLKRARETVMECQELLNTGQGK